MKTGIFGEECHKLGLGIHITTYKTGACTKKWKLGMGEDGVASIQSVRNHTFLLIYIRIFCVNDF